MIAPSSLPRRHQLYADSKAPLGREARLVHSRHVDNLAAGILAGLDLSRRNYYALTKAPSTPVMYHNSPPGATRPHSGVPLAPTGGQLAPSTRGCDSRPYLRARLAPGRNSPPGATRPPTHSGAPLTPGATRPHSVLSTVLASPSFAHHHLQFRTSLTLVSNWETGRQFPTSSIQFKSKFYASNPFSARESPLGNIHLIISNYRRHGYPTM